MNELHNWELVNRACALISSQEYVLQYLTQLQLYALVGLGPSFKITEGGCKLAIPMGIQYVVDDSARYL